jgi:hypothetical protein
LRAGVCTVTFQANLNDPGNIASASVVWQAYDGQGLPVTTTGYSGSVPMVFFSGTSTNAIWQANFTVKVPATGAIQWNILASDLAGNSGTVPSGVTIRAGSVGCP